MKNCFAVLLEEMWEQMKGEIKNENEDMSDSWNRTTGLGNGPKMNGRARRDTEITCGGDNNPQTRTGKQKIKRNEPIQKEE